MVKNAHILEELQRREKAADKQKRDEPWYKRADELYKVALSLNPDSVQKSDSGHLQMLIEVRKKMQPAAKP